VPLRRSEASCVLRAGGPQPRAQLSNRLKISEEGKKEKKQLCTMNRLKMRGDKEGSSRRRPKIEGPEGDHAMSEKNKKRKQGERGLEKTRNEAIVLP